MAIDDLETISTITILDLCEILCTGGTRTVDTEVFSTGPSRDGSSDREIPSDQSAAS